MFTWNARLLTSDRVLSLTGPGHAMVKADLCLIEGELHPMESLDMLRIRIGDMIGGGGGISVEVN